MAISTFLALNSVTMICIFITLFNKVRLDAVRQRRRKHRANNIERERARDQTRCARKEVQIN